MIYQNPSTADVCVKLISNQPSVVIIYGINGAKIAQTIKNQAEFTLDLSKLQTGLYFIQVNQNGTPRWDIIQKK